LSTVIYFLVGMIIPKAASITDLANILRKKIQTYSGFRKRSFYSKRANALGPVYWCTSLGSYKLFHFHNLTLLMYLRITFEYTASLLIARKAYD